MTPDLDSINFQAEVRMIGEDISGAVWAFNDGPLGFQIKGEDAEAIRQIVLKAAIPWLQLAIEEQQEQTRAAAAKHQQRIETLSGILAARRQAAQS